MHQGAQIIDGKAVATAIKKSLQAEAAAFLKKAKRKPTLAVVLIGDDPASQVYVKSKIQSCSEVGFNSKLIQLPGKTSQATALKKIKELNKDRKIDGILVQLPLPAQLDPHIIADAIAPEKDADCLTSANQGMLFRGQPRVEPCTPAGVIELLRSQKVALEGLRAVVLGRSEIVGRPMVHLLLKENATVTWVHSKSKNVNDILKSADLIVAAIGKPKFLKASDFKKGAIVVDVGIHRTEKGLTGDVDFANSDHLSAYTPVPGGVGPMTIAMLLKNTLTLATSK